MQINDSLVCKKLLNAVSETLANMAFLSVSPASEKDLGMLEEKLWCFTLDILAPYEAKLSLLAPPRLAREITLGAFGLHDDDILSDDMIRDAMAEIVNTATGVFMTQTMPSDESFKLGLPQISECALEDMSGITCGFKTDNDIFCFIAEGDFRIEAESKASVTKTASAALNDGWGGESGDDEWG